MNQGTPVSSVSKVEMLKYEEGRATKQTGESLLTIMKMEKNGDIWLEI